MRSGHSSHEQAAAAAVAVAETLIVVAVMMLHMKFDSAFVYLMMPLNYAACAAGRTHAKQLKQPCKCK